jgi:hypothetical protein
MWSPLAFVPARIGMLGLSSISQVCVLDVLVVDPRTVQPVVSRYTDWATRPTVS